MKIYYLNHITQPLKTAPTLRFLLPRQVSIRTRLARTRRMTEPQFSVTSAVFTPSADVTAASAVDKAAGAAAPPPPPAASSDSGAAAVPSKTTEADADAVAKEAEAAAKAAVAAAAAAEPEPDAVTTVKVSGGVETYLAVKTFDQLDIPEDIRRGMRERKTAGGLEFDKPSKIQAKVLPIALSGKNLMAQPEWRGQDAAFLLTMYADHARILRRSASVPPHARAIQAYDAA